MKRLLQALMALASAGCSTVSTSDANWEYPRDEELPPDHFRDGVFIVRRTSGETDTDEG